MNPEPHRYALLISTYELGRQPFGLASPAAWLRDAGWIVDCIDLTQQRLPADLVGEARFVGFHLAMHTATRLAGPVIREVRRINASARLCAYGLYAPLNAEWLRSIGVDDILTGEFEQDLVAVAANVLRPREPIPVLAGDGSKPRSSVGGSASRPVVARLNFRVPDRRGLPPLEQYATLQMPDGSRRVVGSTEASRGCKHLCRHCPIVPIYEGQFRIVAPEVVAADIDAQVAAGAQHITFGDPDFLNGPAHAMRIVEALHASHPHVSYDVTIKIEHLLKHRDLLKRMRDTGCLFVTSAVESLDDAVLARLAKGHTRADFVEAVGTCRAAGLTLVPTFVAFHPWLGLEDYCDLLDTIHRLDLVEHVAPVQLTIRLLIPHGSKLMTLDEVRGLVDGFDPATLTYRWRHADVRVDALQRDVAALVRARAADGRASVFDDISELAHERASLARPIGSAGSGARIPHLSEPWYCCAEPNPEEIPLV
jgi:radical SAM superfamily enzyme YgiQ (UPF0313 family)